MAKKDWRNRHGHEWDTRPRARARAFSDWGGIQADVLRDSIAAAANAGGALRFGYTRDGGAYAVGIYGLGEPYTEYLRPGDDIEDFLKRLVAAFEASRLQGAGGAAPDDEQNAAGV